MENSERDGNIRPPADRPIQRRPAASGKVPQRHAAVDIAETGEAIGRASGKDIKNHIIFIIMLYFRNSYGII